MQGYERVAAVEASEDSAEMSPTKQLHDELIATEGLLAARKKDLLEGYALAKKMASTESDKQLLRQHYAEKYQEYGDDLNRSYERQRVYEHMRGAEIVPEELRADWDQFVDFMHDDIVGGEEIWRIQKGLDIVADLNDDDEIDAALSTLMPKDDHVSTYSRFNWNVAMRAIARFSADGKKFGDRYGIPEEEYSNNDSLTKESLYGQLTGYYRPTSPELVTRHVEQAEKAKRLMSEAKDVVADDKYGKWCSNLTNVFFLITAEQVLEGVKILDAEGGSAEAVDAYLASLPESITDRAGAIEDMRKDVAEYAKNGQKYAEIHKFEDPNKPKPMSFWAKLLGDLSR